MARGNSAHLVDHITRGGFKSSNRRTHFVEIAFTRLSISKPIKVMVGMPKRTGEFDGILEIQKKIMKVEGPIKGKSFHILETGLCSTPPPVVGRRTLVDNLLSLVFYNLLRHV